MIANDAGVTVSTIEHLMAAFAMLGVDNAVVEVDGPEMPIMDGSSLPFVRVLDRAGLRPQEAPAPLHRDPGHRSRWSRATSARR